VNYDNSLVMTITVTCNLWAPSSGDDLFTCGAIYLPPHRVAYLAFLKPDFEILVCSAHLRLFLEIKNARLNLAFFCRKG